MIVLVLDPSGSFKEGLGNTGWVLLDDWDIISFGQIRAKDYESRQEYWKSHISLVIKLQPDKVVSEDFRLYRNKASAQVNSEMETSKLLGYLEMAMYQYGIPFGLQMASQAKQRYTDKILVKKGYITISNKRYYINGVNVSGHIVDALRHGLYHKLRITIKEKKNDRT